MFSLASVPVIHSPVTETSVAFGATSLKITLLSGKISGDLGATGLDIVGRRAGAGASDDGFLSWAITDIDINAIQNPVNALRIAELLLYIIVNK